MRKPLVNARRPIVANDSLTRVPPTNARKPPVVNGYLTRRLHVLNAFSMKRLLVTLWPHVLLLHDGWQPLKPSSYGFAAAASMSRLPTRFCGDKNARPLSHVCDTSRTALCARCLQRSSIDRQPQREQRLWQTRPPNNIATRRPHGRKHWPTRPTSDNAKSRPNALQHWRSHYPLWNKVALHSRHH